VRIKPLLFGATRTAFHYLALVDTETGSCTNFVCLGTRKNGVKNTTLKTSYIIILRNEIYYNIS